MADTEAVQPPVVTNGISTTEEEEERLKQRPADIDAVSIITQISRPFLPQAKALNLFDLASSRHCMASVRGSSQLPDE